MKNGFAVALGLALVCEIHAQSGKPPRLLGQWPPHSTGSVEWLNIDGNTAYAKCGSSLRIYDVTDFSRPRFIRNLGDQFTLIAPAGRYAVEFRYYELIMRDMQDRAAPVELSRITWNVMDVAISWPYVYDATVNPSGIAIYNFTNPSAPERIGFIAGFFPRLHILGNTLAAQTNSDILLFDITDRAKPIQGGTIAGGDVSLEGHFAFVLRDDEMVIADIANVQEPVEVGAWGPLPWGRLWGIHAANGIVMTSVFDHDIAIIDVKNPASPKQIGSIAGGSPTVFAHRGNEWLVGNYNFLEAYDLTAPSAPRLLWRERVGNYNREIEAAGNYAFVQGNDDFTRVFDVSSGGSPVDTGATLAPSWVLELAGTNLFLVDTEYNLRIYDVTNPRQPRQQSVQAVSGNTYRMIARGDRLYLASEGSRLSVMNVADPKEPTLEGELPLENLVMEMVANDRYLFTLLDFAAPHLVVFDVVNPAKPLKVADLPFGASPAKMELIDSTLYIGARSTLRIYDVSDPVHPLEKAPLTLPAGDDGVNNIIDGLRADGNGRLLVLGNQSLMVFDVSAPFAPVKISESERWNDSKLDAEIIGNRAFVVAGVGGLFSFQLDGEISEQPTVEIYPEGETHRVRWPLHYAGFQLVSAPSASGPWSPETSAPSPSQMFTLFNEIVVPSRGAMKFYQARKAP